MIAIRYSGGEVLRLIYHGVPTSEVGTPSLVGALDKTMMQDTIESIETRRLDVLEHQAALYGPQTEPAILIEIAELRNRQPRVRPLQRGGFVNELDFDFVRSTVAAALVRLGKIETELSAHKLRQLIHYGWMIGVSVAIVMILILAVRAS